MQKTLIALALIAAFNFAVAGEGQWYGAPSPTASVGPMNPAKFAVYVNDTFPQGIPAKMLSTRVVTSIGVQYASAGDEKIMHTVVCTKPSYDEQDAKAQCQKFVGLDQRFTLLDSVDVAKIDGVMIQGTYGPLAAYVVLPRAQTAREVAEKEAFATDDGKGLVTYRAQQLLRAHAEACQSGAENQKPIDLLNCIDKLERLDTLVARMSTADFDAAIRASRGQKLELVPGVVTRVGDGSYNAEGKADRVVVYVRPVGGRDEKGTRFGLGESRFHKGQKVMVGMFTGPDGTTRQVIEVAAK